MRHANLKYKYGNRHFWYRGYLKNNDINIKSGADVNSVMRDMMSVLLEGALDEELDDKLGYSKYDYRNKATDNNRNGHSQKTMHTSYGDMDVAIPRDRNGISQKNGRDTDRIGDRFIPS